VATIRVQTLLKGTIEVDEQQVITFTTPLLGFDQLSRFVMFQTKPGPLYWLQAIDDAQAAFCVLAPFEAGLDPEMELSTQDVADISNGEADDLVVYTMLVLDRDPAKIRTNLRAPILLSRSSSKAKQIILNDSRLPVQFFLTDLVSPGMS
jgi:flagellar assembly factor FliW